MAFLDGVQGVCDVVRVTTEDESTAHALLRVHTDEDFSLCDALSFVVVRLLGIGSAIALDRHFRQLGEFEVLTARP